MNNRNAITLPDPGYWQDTYGTQKNSKYPDNAPENVGTRFLAVIHSLLEMGIGRVLTELK